MTEIRSIDFPKKDQPLRDDVSALGQMLGDVLAEQHGAELLEQVELVRKASILRREGQGESAEQLEQTLKTISPDTLQLIVKAFSSYLRLVNLAEKVHRIRRNRSYLHDHETAQRGSFVEVLHSLRQAGISADRACSALEALQIRPVFTAHPTESTRRSILEKEYSIIHRLVERLNPDITPDEDEQALARIRDAVTSGWQTRGVSHSRPTVSDELDNLLFYLTDILYRVVPAFEESLLGAFEKVYGEDIARGVLAGVLRFGTWVGGDMDGNPNVTAETMLETLSSQRTAIIKCYLPEIRRLGRYLSQTRGEAGISEALEERLSVYADSFPSVIKDIPQRHAQMPYRCFLKVVHSRLQAILSSTDLAYTSPEEFQGDILLLADSLEANKGKHAGLFGVRRLLTRIRTFGFHLATLDVRQDAELLRRVMGELLQVDDWESWSSKRRSEHLGQLISRDQLPKLKELTGLSAGACEALSVFRSIRRSRVEFGESSTGLFIISMTQGPDDVLTALALAGISGFAEHGVALDIAPLLETVDDLEAGPGILDQLLQLDVYRQHLSQQNNRQVVMVGYSDSNKDSGIVASRWGLQQAQFRMSRACKVHGLKIVYFHGRGGTVSRGGGNLVNGISGAPTGTIGGVLRVTEQGEVINQKYGIRPLALRNLELVTGAVIQHKLSDVGQHPDVGMRSLMEKMASKARESYQQLVYKTPEFINYFRNATPIDVIEKLAIGSRPASRRSGVGIENLRAIPWVFSWAQTRIGLPGVYGMGSALGFAKKEVGIEALREMFLSWSFFRGMINDVEMVLAKSELDIGARYAELAGPAYAGLFKTISNEFDLATDMVLQLKQSQRLLDDQETLRRNIRLRNPYVDPLHIIQIDLLGRWREGQRTDDKLLDALKATVNGIAQGIQNTG